MRRWLIRIPTFLSLALCLATLALWLDGQWRHNWVRLTVGDRMCAMHLPMTPDRNSLLFVTVSHWPARQPMRWSVFHEDDWQYYRLDPVPGPATEKTFAGARLWIDDRDTDLDALTRSPVLYSARDGSAVGFSHGWTTVSPPMHTVTLLLPYWMPATLFSFLPAVVLARGSWLWSRRRRRAREHRCVRCGYDLRSSPERCPECGTLV